MKIVSFLNVTNLERISCDSGYIFQRLVAAQFVGAGHEFLFASPVPIDGLLSPNYRHIPFLFGRQKYEVRFSFPWTEVENLLSHEEPDIVWVNQPELAAAFRAVLSSIGSKACLVTYLHYFPYGIHAKGKGVTFDSSLDLDGHPTLIPLAFLNGVLASDVVLLHSAFAGDMLTAGLKTFSLSLGEHVKLMTVPPPLDPELSSSSERTFHEREILIYNHRLYAQYGTGQFLRYLVGTNLFDPLLRGCFGPRLVVF